jgi:malate synthase
MSTSFPSSRPVVVDSELPAQTESTNGKALISNGFTCSWNTILGMIGTNSGQTQPNSVLNAILPSQQSKNGRALVTDGVNTSWVAVPTDQTIALLTNRVTALEAQVQQLQSRLDALVPPA